MASRGFLSGTGLGLTDIGSNNMRNQRQPLLKRAVIQAVKKDIKEEQVGKQLFKHF